MIALQQREEQLASYRLWETQFTYVTRSGKPVSFVTVVAYGATEKIEGITEWKMISHCAAITPRLHLGAKCHP